VLALFCKQGSRTVQLLELIGINRVDAANFISPGTVKGGGARPDHPAAG